MPREMRGKLGKLEREEVDVHIPLRLGRVETYKKEVLKWAP